MKKISIILVLVCAISIGLFSNYWAAEPPAAWQESTQNDMPNPLILTKSVTDENGKTMQYLVQLPRVRGSQEFAAGVATIKYPVIMYLHMAGGESYIDYQDNLHPNGIITDHIRRSFEFPFIVITPIKPDFFPWRGVEKLVMKALDQVRSEYSCDDDKTYLGGFSMGGVGTFALAADYPTRWAACIVGAGGGDYREAGRYANIPIWIWHGIKDWTVPFSEARKIADTLQDWGKEVLISELPEDHVFTNEMFSETTFKWLLAHSLRKDTTAPEKAFVDPINNDSTFVTGDRYGEASAKVTVKANSKIIGTGLVNVNEMFKVAIPRQKVGTVVEVTLTDVWGNVSPISKRTVVKDISAPSVSVKTVKANNITGKTEANATITVKLGTKVLGKTKASANGSFSVKFKSQAKGEIVSIYASDRLGNTSKAKKVKI